MKVEQLMTKDVAHCHTSTSLNDAAHLMWEHDCGSLPVVEGDRETRVVGMITDRDICMAAYHQGKSLKELRVGDAMSRGVHACAPDDDLEHAQEIMRELKVRRLPVVGAHGELQGLLTLAQLARGKNGKRGVKPAEVGETLASISQPTAGSRMEGDLRR